MNHYAKSLKIMILLRSNIPIISTVQSKVFSNFASFDNIALSEDDTRTDS